MKEFDDKTIDDFLLGQLKGSALEEFETRLSVDQDFNEYVNLRQEAMFCIDAIGDLALRERVNTLHKEAVKRNPLKEKEPFRIVLLLKYAAAVLVIVVVGLWFLQDSSDPNIYDNYYEAYELNFVYRGNPSEDIITAAKRFYSDGDYQEASEQFGLISPDSFTVKMSLAQGISYLETSQFEKAILSFQKLINQKDPIFESHARWFLAMTYFKEGKTKEAKDIIEQIANTAGSFKQQEAKNILKEL